MNPHYEFVSARAKHICEYCYAPEAVFNLAFEVEHIIPLARGGATTRENLALSCRSCNLYKSDFIVGFDETTQSNARLFNPRTDIWNEHFALRLKTGIIEGLSHIGRASIARLKMNSAAQVEARQQWIKLGLVF